MTQEYDRIGGSYAATRIPDPRIAAVIWRALGNARSVLNIGAGSGAYEPRDRAVIAVEPSTTMIALRGRSLATRTIRGTAEALPLRDQGVDAAMAVNTVNHWPGLSAGLTEMRRVARHRVVIFMRDPSAGAPFWLTQRYLPQLDETDLLVRVRAGIEREFPGARAIPIPLAADCSDGFLSAFWARPEAYLDPSVRANMSPFPLADRQLVGSGLDRLAHDLDDGTWDREYGHLRRLASIDLGHRVFVAQLNG